jgi:hypothetical protein
MSIRIADQTEGSCIPGPTHPVKTHTVNGEDFQEIVGGLVPFPHDTIELSYTGSNLTGVVYKLAGATLATLTLSYTGSNLTSIVRT